MTAKKSRKKRKRAPSPAEDGKSNIISTAKGSLTGALVAIAVCLVLTVLASAIAMSFKDPDSLTAPLAFAVLYISSFLSGLISSKKSHETPFICGLFSGGLLMLFFMLASIFVPKELAASHNFIISLLLHALIIVFSILGAAAGKKSFTKRRKPKR